MHAFFSIHFRSGVENVHHVGLSLIIVHNSPKLLEILAEQAINSGCHQTTGDNEHHDHSHHHHH